MPLPLYLLALAVFAMGTSEFMLAGLLPDIALDLGVTVGTAGSLTSAYAIGMIVGAPWWPRRPATGPGARPSWASSSPSPRPTPWRPCPRASRSCSPPGSSPRSRTPDSSPSP